MEQYNQKGQRKWSRVPGQTKQSIERPRGYYGANGECLVNPKGKNPGDVWKIPTQPFPKAHFATFPEKLIEPMIESSCPEWICKKCGKARVRITKPTEEYAKNLGKGYINKQQEEDTKKKEGKIGSASRIETYMDNKPVSTTAQYKTIGWTDCKCKSDWRPGVILDPFMGSGTVAVVAKRNRRNWTGIELNTDYIKIAEQRIKNTMGTLF